MRTRRVAISMTNSTYSGLSHGSPGQPPGGPAGSGRSAPARHAAGITARIERRSAVSGHRLYTAYRLIALRGLCVTRRRASLIVSP